MPMKRGKFSSFRLSQFSRCHLGVFDARQLSEINFGETLRASFVVIDVNAKTGYDIVTSKHFLKSIDDGRLVFEATKKTMFAAGEFARLKIDRVNKTI